jgi:hypothetical protein
MPRAGQPPEGPLSRRGDRSAGNRTADPAQGTFTYNAAGRATTRTSGASTSTYTWGGSDQNELVSKTTAGDTTSYVYGRNDRNGVPMLQPITKNGQTSYIDYDPAGKQLTATGTAAASNPFRYTQGLLDEDTGWLKHGVRWRTTPLPATGPPKTRSARCSHPTPPAGTRTWLVTRQTTSTRHCIDTLGKYGFAGFLAFDVTAEGEAASALLVGEAATALGPGALIVLGAAVVGGCSCSSVIMLNEDQSGDRWRSAKIAASLFALACVIAVAVATLIAHDWIVFAGLLLLVLVQIRFNVRMLSRSSGTTADHKHDKPQEREAASGRRSEAAFARCILLDRTEPDSDAGLLSRDGEADSSRRGSRSALVGITRGLAAFLAWRLHPAHACGGAPGP